MKFSTKVKQIVYIGLASLFMLTGCSTTPKALNSNYMEGTYRYMADAAVFKECSTGTSYPVTFEGDNINVQKAYLKTVKNAGEPLLLHIEGKIVQRDKVDGDGNVASLFVEKFIKFSPQSKCENSIEVSSLTNTHWKLIELNNKQVTTPKTAREASMILKDGRINGSSGCNGFGGTYILDDDKLSFSDKGMMSTQMFCRGSVEKEFLSVMKKMDSFNIDDNILSIFDKDKIQLAKFKAKN